jgi:hypothetical protein
MSSFRRVPYEPDLTARPYHEARGYVLTQGATESVAAKFAWSYVDHHIGRMTVPDAWKSADDAMQ